MAALLDDTLGALLGGVDLGRAGPYWVLYEHRLLRAQGLKL